MADTPYAPPVYNGGQAAGSVPAIQARPYISTDVAIAILAVTSVVLLLISVKIVLLCAAIYRQKRALQQQQQQDVAVGELWYQRNMVNANKGLSEIQIAGMPARKYGEDHEGRRKQEGEEECAVCLSEFFLGAEVKEMVPCGHVFHLTCIHTWLRQGDTCPMCRVSLRPPPRYRINTNYAVASEQTQPIESSTRDSEIQRQRVLRVNSEGEATRDVPSSGKEGNLRPAGRSLSWAAISCDSSNNVAARWTETLTNWSASSGSHIHESTSDSRLSPKNIDWFGDPGVDSGEVNEVAGTWRQVPSAFTRREESPERGGNSSIYMNTLRRTTFFVDVPSYTSDREGGTNNTSVIGDFDLHVPNSVEWGHIMPSSSQLVNYRQQVECKFEERRALSETFMDVGEDDWQEIDLEEGWVVESRNASTQSSDFDSVMDEYWL